MIIYKFLAVINKIKKLFTMYLKLFFIWAIFFFTDKFLSNGGVAQVVRAAES